MPPANKYPCLTCGAEVALAGARVFAPIRCPGCGAVMRARKDFAGYQLGEPLARSGLGILFHATDPISGVECALKIIHPPSGMQPEDVRRFITETRAAAALEHPHCVRTIGVGSAEGLPWVAMELLTGGSLAGRLAGVGRLREATVLGFALQAASALAAAEAAGLIHRDLEPNNLVFDEGGSLKITDFGQAVFYERASIDVGIIWGRPSFVPPERFARADEDAQADIYGLGATLFRALAGEPPYGGETHGQILFDRMSNEQMRVEKCIDSIHPGTAAVLNGMLTASRVRRFQSWPEVLEQLAQAHTEVTGRSVPLPPVPQPPLRTPPPEVGKLRVEPPPVRPRPAPSTAAAGARLGFWAAVLLLVAIGVAVMFLGWRLMFGP